MTTIEYFRCAPDVTLHIDTDGSRRIDKANNAVSLSSSASAIIDILLRLPDSSAEELQIDLILLTQTPFDFQQVEEMLAELLKKALIVSKKCELRLNMPYPMNHHCEQCGCSCMAQLVGPLSDEETSNIKEAHKNLCADGKISASLNPLMKGLKPDGTCLQFLHFPEKKCAFLDENGLCRIHGTMGAMQKPAACRRFPCIAIAAESEIRLGIKPYCYANMHQCSLTPADEETLHQYQAEHKAECDDLIQNANYRPVIRVSDSDERLQARLQEVQILSWLQKTIPFPAILASLIQGTLSSMTEFPKPFIQDVSRVFQQIAPMLETEVQGKFGDTVHAHHALDFCALLRKPLKNFDSLSPDAPFGRFARYAIFEAVFLRETSRFPAISLGAFAYALGALAASQDPDKSDVHLTAWMRMLAQTQAFTILFPNPQAMASLTRHLMQPEAVSARRIAKR